MGRDPLAWRSHADRRSAQAETKVDDADRYRNEYVPRVIPFLEKHGGEVLVAGFEAEAAEGEPPNSTIVLRFPDAGAAWCFLSDPDYRPV